MIKMINAYRGICLINLQYQPRRLAHRIRGKAPIYCKTLKERIDELNYKDEVYTTKIDIGFSKPKILQVESRNKRIELLKKNRSDQNLEQLARNQKLEINLKEYKSDWLKTDGPFHKKNIAEHYGVFEHLYGEGYFIPFLNLEVLYDLKNGCLLPAYSGNVIKPTEALQPPTVTYESDGNSLWTLALTNLDGHLTDNNKEYVHWLIANIPGNFIEKGDTLVEYLRPFPLKGTGYHRYVFVLYKQDGRVSYDLPNDSSLSLLESRTFVTRDWYKKHQDKITPAGLAFFQCDWDYTVKQFFHETLSMKEPIYEYDFPAPYIRPQEWFPRRKPFNLYMDKYRDPKQINKEYLLRKLKNENPFKRPPPPLRFPAAHPLPRDMPSWLKLHERKIRMNWGRINDV